MAAADHTIPLRSAVIAAVQASPQLTAIWGDRFYSEEPPPEPTWPWGKWSSPPVTGPYEDMGAAGSEFRLQLDGFAYGPGEDQVRMIARLLVALFDDAELELEIEPDELGQGEATPRPPLLLTLFWLSTKVVRDTAVAGAYHAIVEFTASTGA